MSHSEEHVARKRIEFLFGRPIAFHCCFVKVTGSVHAALMLSKAIYWLSPERQGQNRGEDNGWFWKSRDEWEAELGLSRWEQETARKQLRHTKFWLEREKRLEHKIFFSIDFVELEKALELAAARASRTEATDLLPEGGNPTSGEVETQPSSETESPPPRRSKSLRRIKEYRLLQRLPETNTTSSEFAAGLHKLMPHTIWDDGAISILWNDCRQKAPECTAQIVLERVSSTLKMKSWARIQNPVGFLLTCVLSAVQAAFSASKRREQARAGGEKASAEREAQRRLQQERELATWTKAEQAFEALSLERKQDIINREREHFLREYPEYRDRARLPGWEQSFRSKAIKVFATESRHRPPDFMLRANTS